MKKLLVLLLVLCGTAHAGLGLGFLGVNDTALVPVMCLDSLTGNDARSDSANVIVWHHGAGPNAKTYTGTVTLDTTFSGSGNGSVGPEYYARLLVNTIDGNKENGPYTGDVRTWNKGRATHNYFSFTKVGGTSTSADNFANIMGDTAFIGGLLKAGVPGYYLGVTNDGKVVEIGTGGITSTSLAANAIDSANIAADAKRTIAHWAAESLATRLMSANGLDTLLKNNRDSINVLSMSDEVITADAIKPGAIDSFAIAQTLWTSLFRRDLSAYSENSGDVGWYWKRLYDFTDGNGVDGIDADIAGISAGTLDTSLLSVWAWNTFMTAPNAYKGFADTLLNRDTTQYSGDATIGGSIVNGGSGTATLDTALLSTWAYATFVTKEAAAALVKDSVMANVISATALMDSIQGRTMMIDSGSVDVAINGSSFGSTINGVNFINKKYTNQWLVFKDEVIGPIMQRITGIVPDSSWFWISPGLANAPVQGTKFWVLYQAADTTLTTTATISLGDTLEVLAMKIDTLQHIIGMAGGSMAGEYATSIGNYLFEMKTLADSIRGELGSAYTSATWEYSSSIGNYLQEMRLLADSLHNTIGDPNTSFIGELTNSICNMIGAYTGVGTSTIKGGIEAISTGACGGTGSNTVHISVSDGSHRISGVTITIKDGGSNQYIASTQAVGYATFALDDGTYYATIGNSPYVQTTIPDTFVIADDYADTIAVTMRSHGSGPAGTTTVWGNANAIAGRVVKNAIISAKLNKNNITDSNGNFIVGLETSVKTDTAGYFEIYLIPNSSLSDTSTYYIFTGTSQGTPFAQFKASVPDSTSWQVRGNR